MEDILDESSIPSINRLVIETIGVGRWKALKVRDAPDLPLTHPLGNLMTAGSSGSSSSNSYSRNSYTLATRQTRAGASGSLCPPPIKILCRSLCLVGRLAPVELVHAPAHRPHVEPGQVRPALPHPSPSKPFNPSSHPFTVREEDEKEDDVDDKDALI